MIAPVSTAVTAKALRLRAEGKVREAGRPSRVFIVEGDTGTHTVLVYGVASVTCTCPARGTCSHIAAALLQVRDERDLAAEAFAQAAAS